MKRNLLLPPTDPSRCTGRTTALALDAIARAVATPGRVCYVTDHHMPGTGRAMDTIEQAVNAAVTKLGLLHISVERVLVGNQYAGHVRVCSNIWE